MWIAKLGIHFDLKKKVLNGFSFYYLLLCELCRDDVHCVFDIYIYDLI